MAEAALLTQDQAPVKPGKRAAKLEKLKKAETFNFAIDPDVRTYPTHAVCSQGPGL